MTFLLYDKEVRASGREFVQRDVAIIVGIDGLEGRISQRRIQSQDAEEVLILLSRDQAVTVEVDGVEEEGKGSLQCFLQVGIVHLFLHGLDEGILADALSTTNSLQVLVPDLRKNKNIGLETS